MLADVYNLDVVGIEMSQKLADKATARLERVTGYRGKRGPMRGSSAVVVRKVESGRDVREVAAGTPGPKLLTCLHACGDLTCNMLRSFADPTASWPTGKTAAGEGCLTEAAGGGGLAGVAVVGCCYHHMPEGSFPLSATVGWLLAAAAAAGAPELVGRDSLRSAVQAPLQWDSDDAERRFLGHHHRALLQVVLERHFPECPAAFDPRAGLGYGMKPEDPSSFASYCKAALAKLGLPGVGAPGGVPEAELLRIESDRPAGLAMVRCFWTLRCVLGPLLETLLLVDRWLYLREEGFQPEFVPLFDQAQSPRNMALVA